MSETTQTHMLAAARAVMANSYSPYSHYQVGACFKAENGELYSGCNIENASYGMTLCAEASALGALISAGNKKITEIALSCSGDDPCPPCGACRQRIAEFATPNTPIYLSNHQGDVRTLTFGELFPQPFNNQFLEGETL